MAAASAVELICHELSEDDDEGFDYGGVVIGDELLFDVKDGRRIFHRARAGPRAKAKSLNQSHGQGQGQSGPRAKAKAKVKAIPTTSRAAPLELAA